MRSWALGAQEGLNFVSISHEATEPRAQTAEAKGSLILREKKSGKVKRVGSQDPGGDGARPTAASESKVQASEERTSTEQAQTDCSVKRVVRRGHAA